MVEVRRVTEHAVQRYCLRKYRDVAYFLAHPVLEEILDRLKVAKPSSRNPKQFFNGCSFKGYGTRFFSV